MGSQEHQAASKLLSHDVQLQQQPDAAVLNKSIKQSVRHFHMLGAIAPFAAASGGANTFLLLTKAMARFIKVSSSREPSTAAAP